MVENTQLIFFQTSSFENILKMHDSAKLIFGKDLNAIEYLDSISYELVRSAKGSLYNFPFDKSEQASFYLLLEVENFGDDTDSKLEKFFEQNEQYVDQSLLSVT
jgi:hypothetical protein